MRNKILGTVVLLTTLPFCLVGQSKIIGGQYIDIVDVPWQVSLHKHDGHYCGASIISNNWLLTAAHCAFNRDVADIHVHAGTSYQADLSEGIFLACDKYIIHPNYNKDEPYNDIALLHLASPLNFNNSIQPIKLNNNSENEQIGTIAMLTGWGATVSSPYPTQMSKRLKCVSMPIISRYEAIMTDWSYSLLTENMLPFYSNGKGAAQGDSGGPAVVYDGTEYVLVGVSSWCAFPKDQTPTVYTKVSNYIEWILKNSIYTDITLTGPTQICNSTGTFILNNLPAGATVQWNTDNARVLRIASGQGTARATVERVGSLVDEIRVSATVNYLGASTTLSHTVQVGTPAPSIYGPFQNGHVMAGICACQSAYYEAATEPGITRYHWEMVDDSPYISLLGNTSRSFPLSVNRDASFAYIRCKQYQEGCGWSEITEEPIYFHDNCCRQWGIGPNPTLGPIELRSYRASDGEASLMRTATPTTTTLRHVQVFSSDGRLVLEQRYPTGTPNAQLDLSPLRPGTYHLLINGTEHHVVVRE